MWEKSWKRQKEQFGYSQLWPDPHKAVDMRKDKKQCHELKREEEVDLFKRGLASGTAGLYV